MKYRNFGKLDWKASALGFGCMRFPVIGEDRGNIDEAEAIRMLRWAIDSGVNYLDTAYPYHDRQSEILVGKALRDGYRERVHLATKLPAWAVSEEADFDRLLNEQLAKLQTDHVDFYLLHGMRRERWEKMLACNILEAADRALEDGRVRHMGFSFHDSLDVFKEVVDGYDKWAMCQIQYNYMNEELQAGTEGLKYAADKGLAVVVMEPLLGGRLVNPPDAVQAIWDEAETKRSAAEWALQWLWNKPEVSVVLSGMSTMQQVMENVESAAHSDVNVLSQDELNLVSRARDKYNELCPIPCTKCQYCMPCPNGVDIPGNFAIYNEGMMYNKPDWARDRYAKMEEGKRASACIACRICEDKCPQSILISQWMTVVDEVLGQGAEYRCDL